MVKKANKGLCPLLGDKPCLGKKCEWMGDAACSIVSLDCSMSCIHNLLHAMAEAGAEGMCDHEEETASRLYS
jgi:hypothetical protein